MHRAPLLIIASACLAVLAACGQKGPLYHPDEGTAVEPTAATPASPATPDSAAPATSAAPPAPSTTDDSEARKRVPPTPTPAEAR